MKRPRCLGAHSLRNSGIICSVVHPGPLDPPDDDIPAKFVEHGLGLFLNFHLALLKGVSASLLFPIEDI